MTRLFQVFIPASVVALLISELLLIASAFILATYVFDFDPSIYLLYEHGLVKILLVVGSILMGLYFQDLYSEVQVRSRLLLAQQLCMVIGVAIFLQGLISYAAPGLRVSLGVMLLGSSLSMLEVFLWRIVFSAYALQLMGGTRVLFVGSSPLLEDITRQAEEHPETGIVVLGYLDGGEAAGFLRGIKCLGPLSALSEVVRAVHPNRIVVGMLERRNRMPVSELLELRMAGYTVEEVGSVYERVCGRVSITGLRPSQLIYSGELGPRSRYLSHQNLLNRVLAMAGVLISLPLLLGTALAVWLSSPGPALYRQVRLGRRGVPFTLYKFRSMRADPEASAGALRTANDDPRITRIGRIIRKLRIDELPQLFNVLKGEMSIVGPRPELPELAQPLSKSIPFYTQRSCVRPGITGWAQISHKYGNTTDDMIRILEYDLYYIKNMSLRLDLYIIFHTIKVMVLARGAQ